MKKVVLSSFTILTFIFCFYLLDNNKEFISVNNVNKKAMCSINTNLINYDIIYETNGGDKLPNGNTCIGNTCVAINEESLVPIPTREGYQFAGWYYDKEFTKMVTAATVSGIAASQNGNVVNCGSSDLSIVIYAKWIKEKVVCPEPVSGGSFNITYKTNGGNKIDDVTVVVGAEPTQFGELPIPTKEGYQFAGWYYDEALTSAVNAKYNASVEHIEWIKENGCEYTKNVDVTLYAKWIKEKVVCPEPVSGGSFNITYKTNGGNKIDDVTVVVGAEPTQFGELPMPIKEGYVFEGWYYDEALTSAVNAKYNASVEHIEWIKENGCEYTKNVDVTLYAKWIEDNGKKCDSIEHPIGGTIKVHYVANNGIDIPSSSICTGCLESDEKLPVPTKEGYIFAGWYYDSKFTKIVSGEKVSNVDYMITEIIDGCPVTGASDVTLYAKWIEFHKKNCDSIEHPIGGTIKVLYVTNNGIDIPSSSICTGCLESDEKLPVPTKEGYEFAGWYYDSKFTKIVSGEKVSNVDYMITEIIDGCPVTGASNVTLYAKWVNKEIKKECQGSIAGGSFIIDYETNGGNKINQMSICIGCDPTLNKLPVPVKDGYEFAGWYYDISLTEPVQAVYAIDVDHTDILIEDGCVVFKNKNRTLYAKWQKVYKNNDIELIVDDDLSSNIVSLSVKNLEKEDKALKVLGNNLSNFNAYDINLLDENNVKVQPNGYVTLKLRIPDKINKDNLVVYRIDNDKLIEYETIIVDNYVEIQTNHFSIYVIGEKKKVSNPETGDSILIYLGLSIILIAGSLIVTKKLKFNKQV